ncbi:Predicted arabinose efflux permease, MFS family [Austwickia chelonae]|uniref:Putative major facilitator superfamily transporter n=1 Tax=Austwickia chelonae NBRC 105200 TaxID=1184607 RepID=K6VVV2_9MICO|nr:MFS transporter [Austwickia chelonae]GAB79465.1 putative major facilitator superfamily transporter [Austwickia chelonae NBRC 105200]SEV88323.1 Predicted arabinose efflux permease, MFS family [Austwickia chelonae]
MIGVLRDSTYAKLFGAQVIALLGTGLLTVALSLLAFDIAGGQAGIVLGTALTIKMVAYVAVSPVIAAAVAQAPRRVVLICADLVRAGVALALPFVGEAWQIYLLIFVLQSASATFTPAFQAVIPDVLPREEDYTRALSLSRLAYDLESVFSPVLAAALLTVTSYHHLFLGTVVGFLGSALLVTLTRLPAATPQEAAPFRQRITLGSRALLAHRELRSLLAMNLVVAAATAMVIVNTVLLVRGHLGREQSDVALMFAAYGTGSMVTALAAPRLLERITDRQLMLTGTATAPAGLLVGAALLAGTPHRWTWIAVCTTWFVLGAANSTVLTSSARLIRRHTPPARRPAAFAAQFSLSHACFMLTYPLAGALGSSAGLASAAAALAALGMLGAVTATILWGRSRRDGRDQISAGNPSATAG